MTKYLGDIKLSLGDYLEYTIDNNNDNIKANETLYLFGNNYFGIFKELSNLYETPPCRYCEKAG